jgi:hypothetical protein
MYLKCTLPEILLAPVSTGFVLLASGCVSGTSQKTAERRATAGEQNSAPARKLASAQNVSDPGIDLNCIFDPWQSALASLMGISGMSSTIALVRNSSSTIREDAGKMKGYEAIEYSVDTTRASGAEVGLYRSTLGPGGFEKGTVWVASQGCPVKLSLDSEMHLNNGRVDKEHYQEEMVKK